MIDVGCVRIFGAMFAVKAQAEPLQPIRLQRSDFIRAAHFMPELEQKRGDPAHPAAGHADEMHPMPLLRQNFLQISLRGAGHDRIGYIFPSFRPRARPHFSARDAQNFPTCAGSLVGSLINSRIFRASTSPESSDSFRMIAASAANENLGVARLMIVRRVADTESKSRATKRRRAPPDWPRPNGRSRDPPRCKLPPSDDGTRRRTQEFFRADNCRRPDVRRARRKDG